MHSLKDSLVDEDFNVSRFYFRKISGFPKIPLNSLTVSAPAEFCLATATLSKVWLWAESFNALSDWWVRVTVIKGAVSLDLAK